MPRMERSAPVGVPGEALQPGDLRQDPVHRGGGRGRDFVPAHRRHRHRRLAGPLGAPARGDHQLGELERGRHEGDAERGFAPTHHPAFGAIAHRAHHQRVLLRDGEGKAAVLTRLHAEAPDQGTDPRPGHRRPAPRVHHHAAKRRLGGAALGGGAPGQAERRGQRERNPPEAHWILAYRIVGCPLAPVAL